MNFRRVLAGFVLLVLVFGTSVVSTVVASEPSTTLSNGVVQFTRPNDGTGDFILTNISGATLTGVRVFDMRNGSFARQNKFSGNYAPGESRSALHNIYKGAIIKVTWDGGEVIFDFDQNEIIAIQDNGVVQFTRPVDGTGDFVLRNISNATITNISVFDNGNKQNKFSLSSLAAGASHTVRHNIPKGTLIRVDYNGTSVEFQF